MPTWQIGDVTITAVVETEVDVPLGIAFPHAAAELRDSDVPFVNEAGIRLAMQSFLIAAGERRIVVDLGIGNDKHRELPGFQPLHTDHLDRMTAAGFGREDVDTVVFTHLHHDHVGWATVREGADWVPTFPRARHLLDQAELDFWSAQSALPVERSAFEDSLRPVIDAGLIDAIHEDHAVTDEISLVATPGHTSGHRSVRIRSRGQQALITGDLIHHVCQAAVPERIAFLPEHDAEQAIRTRRAFLDAAARCGALVIGTHFPAPTAGHVRPDGAGYRIEF